MSEKTLVENTEPQSGGHPHDLLARLYREIGISAVAAALEASQLPENAPETCETHYSWVPLGDDLAA